MENQQSFEYTYSARRQQEIQAIRQEYLPREQDKMEQLRRLHHSATRKAQAAAISFGVIGSLILGTGMSLCMTELGAVLGQYAMLLGVVIGLAGLGMAVLAYPLYNRILRRERTRIAPEILRLSDELMGQGTWQPHQSE